MAVPTAPPDQEAVQPPFDCSSVRPPETDQDAAIAAAGWILIGEYRAGWGITLVDATSSFDGMCRPASYQWFVFVQGVFAGTLSPDPMVSRTDGAGSRNSFDGSGQLTGTFRRYAADDPLCCPSLPPVVVQYRVDETERGPVVVPLSAEQAPG